MCDILRSAWPLQGSENSPEPSFHHFKFGAVRVTALCDGHFPLSAQGVLRSDGDPIGALMAEAALGPVVPSHVNAYLVDDGQYRILIDAGAGNLQDDTLGQMDKHLKAAGYRPEDIDLVLVTHLHSDHIGGLARNGEAVFPRAIVQVPSNEAAFWLETSDTNHVDPSVRATFANANATLAPYIADKRCRFFEPGTSWPGPLTAECLPGHTAGHTGYRLHAGKKSLMFCGDLFHVLPVQLAHPGVTVCYDDRPKQAAVTREDFLACMARSGDIVAAAHAPFPGLGQISKQNSGYNWHPKY